MKRNTQAVFNGLGSFGIVGYSQDELQTIHLATLDVLRNVGVRVDSKEARDIFAAGVVPIAYRYYNRKRPGLTLHGGCEGVLGKHAHGALGTVISIIFVFGVLGGYAISYGSGIPMLNNILHNLLGTPESLLIDFILIAAVTALFCWSACSGVAKGIQVLSKTCVVLCFVICGCFLVLGHTGFQINNTVESTGILFAVFLSITPLCLIVSGSSLAGFKSVLIITAVPISILIIMCLISCQKWLFQDYGDWTSQEIQKYFSVYEDDIPIFDNHGNLINNVVLDDETGERLDVAETETAETTENA